MVDALVEDTLVEATLILGWRQFFCHCQLSLNQKGIGAVHKHRHRRGLCKARMGKERAA
jgi:hypothetical protein